MCPYEVNNKLLKFNVVWPTRINVYIYFTINILVVQFDIVAFRTGINVILTLGKRDPELMFVFTESSNPYPSVRIFPGHGA